MSDLYLLSKAIKKERCKKGLSQRQLAKAIGVSNSEISKIELCKRIKPSPNILKKIAHELLLDYSNLMELAGYKSNYYLKKNESIESEYLALIEEIMELGYTPDQIRKLIRHSIKIKEIL